MSIASSKLLSFTTSLETYSLPTEFTYPFHYKPHPLALLAAKELQETYLPTLYPHHNFGHPTTSLNEGIGKMFGVLVVQTAQKEIKYLAAFSGKVGNKNHYPYFVPPVFDILTTDGFFRKEEAILNTLNQEIEQLENSSNYINLKQQVTREKQESIKELAEKREEIKKGKKARKEQREIARESLSIDECDLLEKRLVKTSQDQQFTYKRLAKKWKQQLLHTTDELQQLDHEIQGLKETRKKKSATLQKKIFQQYTFLNAHQIEKSLFDIFQQIPPAGAGECAAPKLLQYAYSHDLQPIALAEFWWGTAPSLEVRRHQHFYPACKSKCKPILSHMLTGLKVAPNPLLHLLSEEVENQLEIIYEDDAIAIVNKPAEFLSVPGKEVKDSIYTRMLEKYPQATGPMIVHRLDMSTSGLLIVAKTKEAHHHLQEQFQSRKVKKRYVALLDGKIKDEKGEIKLPLRVDLDNRPYQMVCYTHGKPSHTIWKVIDQTEHQTRVHFFPITGRTHQLRVHAAHTDGLNAPILGDDLYGQSGERLHLHAEHIVFQHPTTGEKLKFTVKASF